MTQDDILDLRARMAQAVEVQDFERATQLRDQLVGLTDGLKDDSMGPSKIRRQVPGKMGLGPDQQVYTPPPGWVPPSRPDPHTSARKGRKRRG